MTKSAPGHNSTKRAIHFEQDLFIAFSFDGVKSKNIDQQKTIHSGVCVIQCKTGLPQ